MGRQTKLGKPAANREQAILEASLRLFAEKGLKAATMRDIAGASGLTEGTLYHYFSGKDQIIARIIERYGFSGRAVTNAFEETTGSLRDKLMAVGGDFLAVLTHNPHVTALLLSEGPRYSGAPAANGAPGQAMVKLIRGRTAALAAILETEVVAGRAQACDSTRSAMHFFNALGGYWLTEVFLAGRMPGRKARHAHLEDLVDLLVQRLQPGSGQKKPS